MWANRGYHQTGELLWTQEYKYHYSKRHGVFQTFYKSGALRTDGKFFEDRAEGPWVTYYEDGTVMYTQKNPECGPTMIKVGYATREKYIVQIRTKEIIAQAIRAGIIDEPQHSIDVRHNDEQEATNN